MFLIVVHLYAMEFGVMFIFIKLNSVHVFVKGSSDARLQQQDFLVAMKTHWCLLAVFCFFVWLLSFWYIPHFHSQFHLFDTLHIWLPIYYFNWIGFVWKLKSVGIWTNATDVPFNSIVQCHQMRSQNYQLQTFHIFHNCSTANTSFQNYF